MSRQKTKKASKAIGFVSKADTAELRAYQRQAALFPPLSHNELVMLSRKFIEGRAAQMGLDEAELVMTVCGGEWSDSALDTNKDRILSAYKTYTAFLREPMEPLDVIARLVSEQGNILEELYEKRNTPLLPELFWCEELTLTGIYPECSKMTKSQFAEHQGDILSAATARIAETMPEKPPKDVVDLWADRTKEIEKHYPSALKTLPITKEQKRKARRKAEIGQQALDSMANHNLQLAMSRVGRIMKTNARAQQLGVSDLIGAANVGLIMGARQFDPDMGRKFSTYAAFHIDGQLYDFVNAEDGKSGIKGLSLHEQKQLTTLITIKTTFKKIFNREATMNELQSLSGISINIIKKRLATPSVKTQSINSPVGKDGDDGSIMLEDVMESADNVDSAIDKDELQAIIKDLEYEIGLLPDAQRKAITLRTGIGNGCSQEALTARKAAKECKLPLKEFNEIYNLGIRHLKARMELKGWDASCLELVENRD